MKSTKQLLGGRIKELRKARALSQDALSERIGIDPKHVSRIEVGKSYPSLDTLEKIAVALNVEIKDIFEFMHQASDAKLLEDIRKMLKGASSEDLRIIFKIVRAIVR